MKWYEAILVVAAVAWLCRRLRGGDTARRRLDLPEATLRAYRRAVEIAPDDAGAHRGLAQALYDLGRYDEAIASFGRAAEIDPGFATDVGRGMALLRLGRYGDALEPLDRAVRGRPDDANLRYSLGCALAGLAGGEEAGEAQERYARAEVAFKETLRLDPHHSDAALALEHVRKRMRAEPAA